MNKLIGIPLFLYGLYLLMRSQWTQGGEIDVIFPPTNGETTSAKCEHKIVPLYTLLEKRTRDTNFNLQSISWHNRQTGKLLYTVNATGTQYKLFGPPKALVYNGPDTNGKCFYEALW